MTSPQNPHTARTPAQCTRRTSGAWPVSKRTAGAGGDVAPHTARRVVLEGESRVGPGEVAVRADREGPIAEV